MLTEVGEGETIVLFGLITVFVGVLSRVVNETLNELAFSDARGRRGAWRRAAESFMFERRVQGPKIQFSSKTIDSVTDVQ